MFDNIRSSNKQIIQTGSNWFVDHITFIETQKLKHDRVYTDIMKQTLYRHIVKTKTQNIFSSEYVVYLYYLYIRLQIIIKVNNKCIINLTKDEL